MGAERSNASAKRSKSSASSTRSSSSGWRSMRWSVRMSMIAPPREADPGRQARLGASAGPLLGDFSAGVRSCCFLHLPRFAAHELPGGIAYGLERQEEDHVREARP